MMMSEFYERKRRLAYTLAVLALALLVTGLYFGFFIEAYGRPVAVAGPDALYVLYRAASSDDPEEGTRLLVLDPSFGTRAQYRLIGEARALLAEGGDLTTFFGNRYSVIRDGQSVRGADLGQRWPVAAAMAAPQGGEAWVFGWDAGKIVARKRLVGTWSEEIAVAAAASVERLSVAPHASGAPLVSWRETGSSRVKSVLYDGREFKPGAEFEIGPARFWDVASAGPRLLAFTYDRNDRTFSRLVLRLHCCAGCGLPPPPPKAEFLEPVLLLGRQVTGLAAATFANRIHIVVTRATTVQGASLPVASLVPEPRARLAPLGAVPLGHRIVAALFPVLMLFFSFSLVFLGFTLLRERGRFVLEMVRPAAAEGPPVAEILQRAMANIIDWIVLIPVFALLTELLNVAPETTVFDLGDPKWQGFIATWAALHVAYHFLLEWTWGRTVGKKIIGIRVAQEDGSRLTFRGALVRNLVRLFDAEFPIQLFIGTSFLAATKRRQRLGDLLARTVVLQDRVPAPRPSPPQRAEEVLHSPRRRL